MTLSLNQHNGMESIALYIAGDVVKAGNFMKRANWKKILSVFFMYCNSKPAA